MDAGEICELLPRILRRGTLRYFVTPVENFHVAALDPPTGAATTNVPDPWLSITLVSSHGASVRHLSQMKWTEYDNDIFIVRSKAETVSLIYRDVP